MADKKPYTLSTHSDGITSLTIAGLTEIFKSRKVLNSFALQLAEQLSDRRTGMFRLQDEPDGKVSLIMHKTGNIIHFKDYEQAAKLVDILIEDTTDRDNIGDDMEKEMGFKPFDQEW